MIKAYCPLRRTISLKGDHDVKTGVVIKLRLLPLKPNHFDFAADAGRKFWDERQTFEANVSRRRQRVLSETYRSFLQRRSLGWDLQLL